MSTASSRFPSRETLDGDTNVTLNAAFAGIRRVPQPVNEPNKTYAPGSPEKAALKARLKSMAAEKIDIPLIIGGREIRTGKTRKVGDAARPRARAGRVPPGRARTYPAGDRGLRRRAPRVVGLAVGRPRRGAAARRRAPGHLLASDDQRRDDARPVEDGVPGGDRRRVRDDRLLALQRLLRAGALQRAAVQRPGVWNSMEYRSLEGLRLRRLAVQLHRDRRQPDDRAGAPRATP